MHKAVKKKEKKQTERGFLLYEEMSLPAFAFVVDESVVR